MNIKFIAILLFLLTAVPTVAQLKIESLHYRDRIDSSATYLRYDKGVHSSVLPLIPATPKIVKNADGTVSRPITVRPYPIGNLQGGMALNESAYPIGNIGIGAGVDLYTNKLFFTAKYLPTYQRGGFVTDSISQAIGLIPGSSRALSPNLYAEYEFVAAYRPVRFFTFSGGVGRNFFGEGYRSLIYSDNAGSTPFFKIETSFGNIKYVNIYNGWKDNTVDPTNASLDQRKYSAMHYISWNIVPSFNLSVFETVVWQVKDGPVERGFDLNYLNPVVFYRPVEYGVGSADNVLLGLNMNYKINHHSGIYTQLILDDFLLAEIRARSRWWANKYGFQLGYKSDAFLNHEKLYFQAEFNVVRPFTYAHKFSTQSYGHLNQSVTHPIGANFCEILNILSYQFKKTRITNKMVYSGYGVNSTDTINVGQNPFDSYNDRNGDYDHFLLQGFKKNVFNETLVVEYNLLPKYDLYLNVTYNWRIENTTVGVFHSHAFLLGLKSRLWNKYTDL